MEAARSGGTYRTAQATISYFPTNLHIYCVCLCVCVSVVYTCVFLALPNQLPHYQTQRRVAVNFQLVEPEYMFKETPDFSSNFLGSLFVTNQLPGFLVKMILSKILGMQTRHPDRYLYSPQALYTHDGKVYQPKQATALLFHISQSSVFIAAFPFNIMKPIQLIKIL